MKSMKPFFCNIACRAEAFLLERKGCCLAVLLMTIVFVLVVQLWTTKAIIRSDALGYYAYVRSLAIDGDLHFENEFQDYNAHGDDVPSIRSLTPTNHVANKYFIGPALLWTPFFVAAHGTVLAMQVFGLEISADGYTWPYHLFMALGSVLYGLLGLVCMERMLRLFFDQASGFWAVSMVVLSTNVIYYLAVEPTMAHAMSLGMVSAFACLWLKGLERRSLANLMFLGLVGGVMVLIRPQNVVFMILPLAELLGFVGQSRNFQRRLFESIFFGLFFLLPLLPQLVVWKILYGKFLVFSYQGEGFDFFHPKLWASLFSDRHGLISWTPSVALGLL
ncbi:MAG: hypothetical protein EOM25_11970, partial [Deltaproteobacteria bacterium]|nr:hypothetical protein [Deltaproteobacteria bacterium]